MKYKWLTALALAFGFASPAFADTNLVFAFWGDPPEVPPFQQIANDYMKAHPDVHIELQNSPWSAYFTKLDAQLAASGLHLPGDIIAESVDLRMNMLAADNGTFNGQLDASGVQLAGQHLDTLRAILQGRRNAHTLMLDARLPAWRLTANLAGGLDANRVWRGQLNQAEVQGDWPAKLVAPAHLLLSSERQQVNGLALSVAGGRLTVEQFGRQGSGSNPVDGLARQLPEEALA